MARVTCDLCTPNCSVEFLHISLEVDAKDLNEAAEIISNNWPSKVELPDVGPLKNITITFNKDDAGFESGDLYSDDIPDEYEEDEDEDDDE